MRVGDPLRLRQRRPAEGGPRRQQHQRQDQPAGDAEGRPDGGRQPERPGLVEGSAQAGVIFLGQAYPARAPQVEIGAEKLPLDRVRHGCEALVSSSSGARRSRLVAAAMAVAIDPVANATGVHICCTERSSPDRRMRLSHIAAAAFLSSSLGGASPGVVTSVCASVAWFSGEGSAMTASRHSATASARNPVASFSPQRRRVACVNAGCFARTREYSSIAASWSPRARAALACSNRSAASASRARSSAVILRSNSSSVSAPAGRTTSSERRSGISRRQRLSHIGRLPVRSGQPGPVTRMVVQNGARGRRGRACVGVVSVSLGRQSPAVSSPLRPAARSGTAPLSEPLLRFRSRFTAGDADGRGAGGERTPRRPDAGFRHPHPLSGLRSGAACRVQRPRVACRLRELQQLVRPLPQPPGHPRGRLLADFGARGDG
ncbi:MAG: hypothetical protein MZV64_42835 [Ignavibacteriales bacterium]|nr:hypothetical protein [Ignavibacteriales bacterium]